jgi:hypothetical protein
MENVRNFTIIEIYLYDKPNIGQVSQSINLYGWCLAYMLKKKKN